MSPTEEDARPPQPESGSPAPSEVPPTIHSDELLQGARELLIRHGEETYRLRLTRNGKLILQK